MATDPSPTSPWSYTARDNFGRSIHIEISFNEADGAVQDGFVQRDADCQWTKIYFGVGPAGTVESTDKVFDVPAGTTTLTAAELQQHNLPNISDVLAVQVTAGQ